MALEEAVGSAQISGFEEVRQLAARVIVLAKPCCVLASFGFIWRPGDGCLPVLVAVDGSGTSAATGRAGFEQGVSGGLELLRSERRSRGGRHREAFDEPYGAGLAGHPGDETLLGEDDDHSVHARRRDAEEGLHVCFGRGLAVQRDVIADELEVGLLKRGRFHADLLFFLFGEGAARSASSRRGAR